MDQLDKAFITAKLKAYKSTLPPRSGDGIFTEVPQADKKLALKWSVLVIVLTAFSLVVFLNSAYGLYQMQSKLKLALAETQFPDTGQTVQTAERKPYPVRLKIPMINVDAPVEYVGLTSEGAMQVPTKTTNVGWFNLGPRPGEMGSSVIAGHFNGKDGEPGVFAHLNELKEGDKLYTEDEKGNTTTFVIRSIRTYEPGYVDEVFGGSNGVHLNLITCDGYWDAAKKSYSKRLVIFADTVN